MASGYAVLITAYLHMILQISVFLRQDEPMFKEVPPLASWIFLVGLLDMIWHTSFRYLEDFHLPLIAEFVVETSAVILFVEFGILVVWTTMENLCCALTMWIMDQLNLFPCSYTWLVLGFTTTMLSLSCVGSIAIACDHVYFLRKRGRILMHRIKDKYRNLRARFSAETKNCKQRTEDEFEIHLTPPPPESFAPKRTRRQNCSRGRRGRRRSCSPCKW